MNDPRVPTKAKDHPMLRPFAEALELQNIELEGAYVLLREAGDVALHVSTDWMDQLEETCRSGNTTPAQSPHGHRC